MTIFLNAIQLQNDGRAIIKQLEACKEAGIGRVGVFSGPHAGQSCTTNEAITIVLDYIKNLI